MFRALSAIIAAISRTFKFTFTGIGLLAEASWATIVAFHKAIRPTPQTPADAVADEAEAALAQDDAVAPAEERRAMREAQRILAAEKVAAAAPRAKLTAAELADIKRAAVKIEPALKGIAVPAPSSTNPEAQQVRAWWYNSLAGGALFSPRPTLDGLPEDVKSWAKSLDSEQRLSMLGKGIVGLQQHMMSPRPQDWQDHWPMVSPERARIFREFLADRRARINAKAAEQRRQRAAQDPKNDLGESYGPRM